MFGNLMHAILGTNTITTQSAYAGALTGAQQANILQPERASTSQRLFDGRVEVLKVANGYVVNIGRKEGYSYETYIAQSVQEVNEIIATQIVVFRLEES